MQMGDIINAIVNFVSTNDINYVLINLFDETMMRNTLSSYGNLSYIAQILETYDYQSTFDIIWTYYTYNDLLTLIESDYPDELIYRSAKNYSYLFSILLEDYEFNQETYFDFIKTEYGQSFYDQMIIDLEEVKITEPGENMEGTYALKDHTMYGSSRLGLNRRPIPLAFTEYKDAGFNEQGNFTYASIGDQLYALPDSLRMNRILTYKNYELSNHLGNVLVTVTDRRNPIESQTTSGEIAYYEADIASAQDYYPFGMLQLGRSFSTGEYRYGYNTQEMVVELKGVGNHFTAPFWEYDPRIVTRWNRDPVTYPWQSAYVINNNNPIVFSDLLGLFGSRKEAREYKKEHGLKGKIRKVNKGIFSINNKKTSLFRDPSLDDAPNLIGRQEDGVIKSTLITTEETSSPSTGDYVAGSKEFGKRGGKLTKTTTPLKSTGKTKYYDNNWKGNQNVKTKNAINKGLTKSIAKKAPIIGNVITASEIYDGIQADGNAFGANTTIEVAGAAGSYVGAAGAAVLGAAIGSAMFPGVGTVVGGIVGGVLGSWGGEAAAEGAAKTILKE